MSRSMLKKNKYLQNYLLNLGVFRLPVIRVGHGLPCIEPIELKISNAKSNPLITNLFIHLFIGLLLNFTGLILLAFVILLVERIWYSLVTRRKGTYSVFSGNNST